MPTVPETDETQNQAARDDSIDDDGAEETKEAASSRQDEETANLMKQLELPPPEPFRLDELRISAPMLRNELSDSVAFFEKMLIESYG